MATLTNLSTSTLALKGAGTEYNYLQRFFATKAEADAALADGSWVPTAGKLNGCLTGDQGLLVYNEGTSSLDLADEATRAYVDSKLATLVGDAPEVLDTLGEISDALNDNPNFFSDTAAAATANTNLINAETSRATTAEDAIQADVDQNEADADAADAALSARLDTLEADPTTAAAVAAVQADVDQNEADADAADAALGVRIDAVETEIDTARTNIYTALGQTEGATAMGTFTGSTLGDGQTVKQLLQSLETATETEISDRQAAIADILDGATFTGDIVFGTLARLKESGNELKIQNDAQSSSIVLGPKISLQPATGSRIELFETVRMPDGTDLTVTGAELNFVDGVTSNIQTQLDAIQADVNQNETDGDAADAALSGRLDVLEADPTTATAVAAVQADVDQNEADADAADAALSGRLDVLEADPTTETALATERARIDAILAGADADKDTFAEIVTLINSVDTENDNAFAAYVLSNDAAVAAVQADVDQNETDSDAADAALSGRLDVLEADPTTATALAAVQADVDQNEADADAADAALGVRIDEIEDGFAFQGDISTTNNLSVTGTSDFNGTVTAHDITIDAGGDDAILKFTLETDGGADKGGLVWNRNTGGADIGAITYHRSLDTIRFYTNGTSNFDVEIGSGGELNAQNGLAIGGTSVTASADELNFVDGVTSNIQTQLDAIQSDVDQNESDADTAIALKLDASAVSAFGLTLVDDADAAAARTTLGLGSAATTDSGDYATAAQGATADAALPAAGAQAALSVDHLITLSGVAEAADDLGTFTGATINDNVTVKAALQALETAQEATQADVDQNESDADAAFAALLAGTSIPGPYNNDTAAGDDGVAIGAIYKNSNGSVHWRVT